MLQTKSFLAAVSSKASEICPGPMFIQNKQYEPDLDGSMLVAKRAHPTKCQNPFDCVFFFFFFSGNLDH